MLAQVFLLRAVRRQAVYMWAWAALVAVGVAAERRADSPRLSLGFTSTAGGEFWKKPEKNWSNLAKIQQTCGKFCEILEKNSKNFSNF